MTTSIHGWYGVDIAGREVEFRRARGIYVLVDEITGLGYVGSTEDLRKRRQVHLSAIARGVHWNARVREMAANGARFVFLVLAQTPCFLTRQRPDRFGELRIMWQNKGRNLSPPSVYCSRIQ